MNDEMFRLLLPLALARYKREPPDLALMFFMSDRRAAGLGALDEARRAASHRGAGRGDIENTKFYDRLHNQVCYRRRIDAPPRDWIDPEQFERFDGSLDSFKASATVTVTRLPARRQPLGLNVNPRDFTSQQGRNMVAGMLRALRRETTPEATNKESAT